MKSVFGVGVVGLLALPVLGMAQQAQPTTTHKTPPPRPAITTSIPDSLEPTAEVKKVGNVKVTGATSRIPKAPVDKEEMKRQIMRQLGIAPGANVTIVIEDDGPQLDADAEEAPAAAAKSAKDDKGAASTAKEAAAAKNVGQVQVKGARDDFSDPTKTIIGADQLTDPSDRNLLDILEKQSGIIVRDDGVSINGLPPSYTQLLYDGRKFPAGMSLATLRPDQIERIEISFGSDASQSAGGMAGTINVIPKKKISKRSGNIGLNETVGARVNHGIFAGINDRFANGSNYSVFGSANRYDNDSGSVSASVWRNINNGQSGREDMRNVRRNGGSFRNLNGRSNVILPDGSWFGLSLNATRTTGDGYGEDFYVLANSQLLSRGQSASENRSRALSPQVTWDKTVNSKFSVKTSANYSVNHSDYSSTYVFSQGQRRSLSRSQSDTTNRFADLTFIYQPAEGRELQFGGSVDRTKDTSQSTTVGIVDYARRRETSRDEDALFVKWAQRISPKIGVNTGLRWTSLRMQPEVVYAPSQPYHYAESFLTPSLNISYRQNSQNTWLLNYSRTFKPPQQSNLDQSDGQPSVTEVNRPLNTIYRGNSQLRAEVTDSWIGTFSRRWSPTIDSNINVSYRRLKHPLTSVIFSENGTWYSQPVNLDSTRYFSVSMSGKYWRTFGTERKVTVLLTPSITRSWNRIGGVASDVDGFGRFVPVSAYLGVQVKQGAVVGKMRINYTSSVTTFGGLQTVNYEGSTTSATFSVSWAASPKLIVGASLSGIGAQRDAISRSIYRDGQAYMSSESWSEPNTMGPNISLTANYRF